MELDKELAKGIEELRKNEKRKFNQTVEIIVNLQKLRLPTPILLR